MQKQTTVSDHRNEARGHDEKAVCAIFPKQCIFPPPTSEPETFLPVKAYLTGHTGQVNSVCVIRKHQQLESNDKNNHLKEKVFTMKTKKILAFVIVVLMLVVAVVPIAAHVYLEHIDLCGTYAACCDNPNRVNYLNDHVSKGGMCTGTTYNLCTHCGDLISGPYTNIGPCVKTCSLPSLNLNDLP